MNSKRIMKTVATTVLAGVLAMTALTGCGGNGSTASNATNGSSTAQSGSFDTSKSIMAVTREEGSGTRDAFVELTGVLVKDSAGNKSDNTTVDATVLSSTQAVLSNVAGSDEAIGYISLGSLNDTVKAVKVNGVAPSPDTVKDGTYKISRPFNIATKSELNDAAKDFVDYILSGDGQKVVEANGYVAVSKSTQYSGSKPSGTITVAGSSSVSPVMEKLAEAYMAVNTNAKVEVQTSDSSSGMTAASEGTCDIGMASRDLKDSEKEKLTATKIAMDGIAVVINKNNTTEDMTTDQIKAVYTGEITTWTLK
ncbi:MAG TPA: extracellular solute-binding protein [Clostridiales bacterium]|nr:extracellular solute-binding protein [Clostridiales bacterium]